MYTYVYMVLYIYIYTHVSHMFVCMCIYIYRDVAVHIHVTYIVYVSAYVSACVCVRMLKHVYVCSRVELVCTPMCAKLLLLVSMSMLIFVFYVCGHSVFACMFSLYV